MRAAQSFFATAPGGARLLVVEIGPHGDVVTVRLDERIEGTTRPADD